MKYDNNVKDSEKNDSVKVLVEFESVCTTLHQSGKNANNMYQLYCHRQSFDDSIVELQLLVSRLCEDALDDPETIEKVIEVNRQLTEITRSIGITYEIDYRKKSY